MRGTGIQPLTRPWSSGGAVGLAQVVVLAVLVLGWISQPAYGDARDELLSTGPPTGPYPWAAQQDPAAIDPWGFVERQCTSYAAWYLHTHGVPLATRTRGPRGVGTFTAARDWDQGARAAGFRVSAVPRVGSIAEWHAGETSPPGPPAIDDDAATSVLPQERSLTASSDGHVAVVVSVLRDRSVLVTEYDGTDRQFHVLRTRAPRYLYLGLPDRGPAGDGSTLAGRAGG